MDELRENEQNCLKIKKLVPEAILPSKSHLSDVGYDLVAIDDGIITDTYIQYKTGLAIEPPLGHHIEILPRSSITKYDLVLGNSVGLIDCVPAGTRITTIEGEKLVEDLFSLNERIDILSFNEEEYKVESDSITDMWVKENIQLYLIETEDGNIVEVPADKLIYTKSGWKRAIDITTLDEVLKFK